MLLTSLASMSMNVMQLPDGGIPSPTSPEYNTITFDYDSCGNLVWRQGKYVVVTDPGLEPPGGSVLFQGGIGGRSIGGYSCRPGQSYIWRVIHIVRADDPSQGLAVARLPEGCRDGGGLRRADGRRRPRWFFLPLIQARMSCASARNLTISMVRLLSDR